MALLTIEDLSVTYRTPRGPLKAVDGVDFVLEKGRSLGLVGESGSGKSTIGHAIMGLLPKNAEINCGRIEYNQMDLVSSTWEQMRCIRWNKIAMIFQAAMNALNPIISVGDQIAEAIQFHQPHLSPPRVKDRVIELFSMVGIPERRHKDYPHQYSGGMRQRAVIAMALACDPEIIIADEPTTALDVIVQDQILKTIISLQDRLGIGILFISHDISVVADVCHRIGVMYAGQLVEMGSRQEVFETPAHPYTQALMAAHIRMSGLTEPQAIPGQSVDIIEHLSGCRFFDRCHQGRNNCSIKEPPWRHLSATHKILCCRG